ncbi:MAG: phosphonate transport system substrate-binding protein [Gammaproteobacteria bacterium]|jgi:phosphonate transport system substrate-binding protein
MPKLCLPIVLGLSFLLACSSVSATINLRFGVYTSDKPTSMVKKFRPVLRALEQRLGARLGDSVKIRSDVAKDYATGLERLVRGDVDFSRFGPASYIVARQRNERIKVIAMERRYGGKVFYGVICVAQDTPIQRVEDLRGQRFAFGNERSTIGRYLAQKLLLAHGLHSSDLAGFAYLGRHDKVVASVAAGQFDAGAVKESTYRKALKAGAKLRVLARFENVTKPWVAAGHLKLPIRSALRNVLLAFDAKEPLAILKVGGFIAGNNSDYADIREAMTESRRF